MNVDAIDRERMRSTKQRPSDGWGDSSVFLAAGSVLVFARLMLGSTPDEDAVKALEDIQASTPSAASTMAQVTLSGSDD